MSASAPLSSNRLATSSSIRSKAKVKAVSPWILSQFTSTPLFINIWIVCNLISSSIFSFKITDIIALYPNISVLLTSLPSAIRKSSGLYAIMLKIFISFLLYVILPKLFFSHLVLHTNILWFL